MSAITCKTLKELHKVWAGAIGEYGTSFDKFARTNWEKPSLGAIWSFAGSTMTWGAELSYSTHERRHTEEGVVRALCLRVGEVRSGVLTSRLDWQSFVKEYHEHPQFEQVIEKIEGWSQMDLLLKTEDMSTVFHFPGWRPLELTEEARRVLTEHGVLMTSNGLKALTRYRTFPCLYWVTTELECSSTLVIPLFECYSRYRTLEGESFSVEAARAALGSERKFLDAWELFERTIFSKPYLQPVSLEETLRDLRRKGGGS